MRTNGPTQVTAGPLKPQRRLIQLTASVGAGLIAAALHSVDDLREQHTWTQQWSEREALHLQKKLEAAASQNTQLASSLSQHTQNATQIFEQKAALIYHEDTVKTLIQLAPKGIISAEHPDNNSGQIDLNLFTHTTSKSASLKAKLTRKTILHGPFKNDQGGKSLLIISPIFTNHQNHFYGLVTTVIDWQKVLNDIQADASRLGLEAQAKPLPKPDTGASSAPPSNSWIRKTFTVKPSNKQFALDVKFLPDWLHELPSIIAIFIITSLAIFSLLEKFKTSKTKDQTNKKTLRDQDQLISALFEQGTIAKTTLNNEGVIKHANNAFAVFLNKNDASSLQGKALPLILEEAETLTRVNGNYEPLTAESFLQLIESSLSKHSITTQWIVHPKRMEEKLVKSTLISIIAEGDIQILCTLEDVTEQLRNEQELQQMSRKYKAAFEQSTDAILIMNEKAQFIDGNPACIKTYGVKNVEELLLLTPKDFSPELQPDGTNSSQKAAKVIAQATCNGQAEVEWLHKKVDSGEQWTGRVSVVPITDGAEPLFLVRVRDVSQENSYQKRLHELAYIDRLTQLSNRTSAQEWIEQELKKSGHICHSIIHFDVDNFQSINDNFGMETGDTVLVKIGRLLENKTDTTDLVARLDSDAFLVGLRGFDSFDAEAWAGDIQQAMTKLSSNGDLAVPVTLSAGITTSKGNSTISPNQLLQEANTALSQARQQGRSQIALYSSIMSAAIERRIAIERDLEEERNHDFPSFSLHYQPQFDAEQQICGAEALIRWKKGNGTLVAPDEFIPIAEESGHIHAMARWVITEACRQIAEWRENYDLTIPIAINISAKQFEPLPSETSLALLLEQTLENLSIPTNAIELEITETALLNSGDAAMQEVLKLTNLGFNLAIDDFGTGFASMELLQRIPAQKLKVDRCFVNNIETSQANQAIAQASILIADKLEYEVVAEGVETLSELNTLISYGFKRFQGYYFSAALPKKKFAEKFLKDITKGHPASA